MTASLPAAPAGEERAVGVLLVDKPAGLSSFAVVRRVRWLLGIKKVGHAGTLDPFATGLLILCIGRAATRNIALLQAGKKTYQARLQLGVVTDTQDTEGQVTRTTAVPELTTEILTSTLLGFLGAQQQAPPPYSAAKHQGKPLYAYARQGVFIVKDARPIEIHAIELTGYDSTLHQMEIKVCCSKGTYIRVLAADIGTALGCGAHCIALRRLASGPFTVEESVDGAAIFSAEGLGHAQQGLRDIEDVLGRLAEPVF